MLLPATFPVTDCRSKQKGTIKSPSKLIFALRQGGKPYLVIYLSYINVAYTACF